MTRLSKVPDSAISRGPRPSLNPRLAALEETLGRTGWAVELFDAEWRLVWVSSSLRAVLRTADEQQLGIGRHLVEAWTGDLRRAFLSPESGARSLAEITAFTLDDTPGGKEALRRLLGARWPPELEPVEAVPAPDVWAWSADFQTPDASVLTRLEGLMVRCRDETGSAFGTFFVYSSGLPANVLALLVRGDEELFTRTAALMNASRHAAAILFADLEASASLAKRLEPRLYFDLLSALLTRIDAAIARHGGIVGKHGGDGTTAFFLADQLGGRSSAARAALEVARSLPQIAVDAAAEASGALDAELELHLNRGVHWADALYLGQVITGGRLEVTALGAEVNECARLQQSVHEGGVLASKCLLDRLDPANRSALGLAEERAFTVLRELPTATAKARRDAGDLLVARL